MLKDSRRSQFIYLTVIISTSIKLENNGSKPVTSHLANVKSHYWSV
jgi:hypothetical protein